MIAESNWAEEENENGNRISVKAIAFKIFGLMKGTIYEFPVIVM
jgi:hypothetical protein